MKSNTLKLPAILYHGTNAYFDVFDLYFRGSNIGYPNTVYGIFFTENLEHAQMFGSRIISVSLNITNPINLSNQGIFTIESQAPVIWEILSGERLSPKKALRMLDKNIGLGEIAEAHATLNTMEASNLIKSRGYDSMVSDMGQGNLEYVAFYPDQICVQDINFFNQNKRVSSK
ncbi:hypothetical protein [Pedobacter sp. MC2016-24]|uniref:ADP-ribosyltransferase-containing protein n=1 Tax=Pedobacter sp. MC2016-24 TaxID=2780090 RepID=UPI001880AD38|nr:hypothetical protein [Pedobacter sp. MC2016-24]MBE9599872.1 hypothetical protein [Pedobacter sp. MC2016-24]